jgi:hypothetical protein
VRPRLQATAGRPNLRNRRSAMKTRPPFRFPVLDTVMNAAVLCAVAALVAVVVFGPDVAAVLA